MVLLTAECTRLGIASTVSRRCDLDAVPGRSAFDVTTKLVIVETIANPLLHSAGHRGAGDDGARRTGARLLVDNTFASPAVCRPVALGVDLVMESLTKSHERAQRRLPGDARRQRRLLAAGTQRDVDMGAGVEPIRLLDGLARAGNDGECASSARPLMRLAAARYLTALAKVAAVYYPGLETHPDHALAARQFMDRSARS